MTDSNAGVERPGPEGRPQWRDRVRPSRRTALRLTQMLAVLLVVGTVAAVWLGLQKREADQRARDRADAINVASQFALRMDNVDGTDFDAYITSVNELLTTKARTENSKVFDAIKQSYEVAKVKGTGKVLLTGMGESDDDSATVLVVHDADVTSTQGKVERHYRWAVDLVKVRGDWRVDDFSQVS